MEEVPPGTEALLVHRAFLVHIARGLLNHHDAEDAVQESYLKAMKRPMQYGSSPRAWLGAIARNTSRRLAKRESMRSTVEQRGRRSDSRVPSPTDVLEREETRRRVVAAILGLPDNDREVLLLRFYEEHSPREISHALSMPIETVRSRIKRALARLRRVLQQDTSTDWHHWATGMLPRGGMLGAATSIAELGGILAMKKLVAAAVVCVLFAASVWVAHRYLESSPTVSDDLSTRTHSSASAKADDERASRPVLRPGAGTESTTKNIAFPHGTVHGVVVDIRGAPVVGAAIRTAWTRDDRWFMTMRQASQMAKTDERGRFCLAPTKHIDRVHASARGFVGASVYWTGGDAPVRLVLRRANTSVRGTVINADGNGVPRATVHVFTPEGHQHGVVGHTDAKGRYSVPFITGIDSYLRVWASGYLDNSVRLFGLRSDAHDAGDIVLQPAYRVEGRVTDLATGEAVADARITTHEMFGKPVRTNADGQFRFQATSELSEVRILKEGYGGSNAPIEFSDGTGRVDVGISPRSKAEVFGTVLAPNGRAVRGACVNMLGKHEPVRTDANGAFRITIYRARDATSWIVARAPNLLPEIVEAKPEQPLEIRLGHAVPVKGTVRLPSGRPATAAHIQVSPLRDSDNQSMSAIFGNKRFIVDGQGRFHISELPVGRYRFRAIPGHGDNATPTHVDVTVRANLPTRDVELKLPPGLEITGTVSDVSGNAIPFASVRTTQDGTSRIICASEQGTFRIVAHPNERIDVQVHAADYRNWSRTFTAIDPSLDVVLMRAYTLQLVLKGEWIPPPGSQAYIQYVDREGRGNSGGSVSVLKGVVRDELWIDSPSKNRVAIQGLGWKTNPVLIPEQPEDGMATLDVQVIPKSPGKPIEWPGIPGTVPRTSPTGTDAKEVEVGSIVGHVNGSEAELLGAEIVAHGAPVVLKSRVEGRDVEHKRYTHRNATIEKDGTFKLADVPVGTWTVQCKRNGRRSKPITVTVKANEETQVDSLQAPPIGRALAVSVVDAEGKPISGVGIRANAIPRSMSGLRASRFEYISGSGTTGPDGLVTLQDLGSGAYLLTATHPRGNCQLARVAPGENKVVMPFVWHGLIRGVVEGPWGTEQMLSGSVQFHGTHYRTGADLVRNGLEFAFEQRVPPGTYTLMATMGNYVNREPATVNVLEGSATQLQRITMVSGGSLTVQLVDENGAPTKGRLSLPDTWSGNDQRAVARYERETFELNSLPLGTWTIRAEGRKGNAVADVSIEQGSRESLRLTLTK